MARVEEQRISLHGISLQQRRLVERHLPLVRLTLNRHSDLANPRQPGREASELVQEGCLALVEAVRSHDPLRHGSFASFAMARIHFAMSRFAHEHSSLIRVPFITQRRRRKRRADTAEDRHSPEPLPRVVRMNDPRRTPSQTFSRRLYSESMSRRREGVTIGDLVRDCYDRAASCAVSQMKSAPQCTSSLRTLVDRCSHERWTIPEPYERTPVRQLAGALGCSLGRITHCEERFRKRVAALLEADITYAELIQLGRQRTDGWRHSLTPRELASLRRCRETDEKEPQGPKPAR